MFYEEGGLLMVESTSSQLFQQLSNAFEPITKPTRAELIETTTGKPYALWGNDNLFPIDVLNAINGYFLVQMCLDKLARKTYGNGLGVYEMSVVDSKKVIVPIYEQKQQEWLRSINANQNFIKSVYDYWGLGNFYWQFIFNKGYNKIARAIVTPAFDVRQEKLDKDGYCNYAYLAGDWKKPPPAEKLQKIPMLDPQEYSEQLLNERQKIWMYPGMAYSIGRTQYQSQAWHAALIGGIIDIATALPKIKKSIINNSMIIKYHVRIDERYWTDVYGSKEWKDFKPEERLAKRQAKYQEIDNRLTGVTNQNKNIFSPKEFQKDGTRDLEYITIDKIETDPGKNSAFWADIQAVNSQIITSFTFNNASIGTVLSDSRSNGGGSDIRESDMEFKQDLKMDRDVLVNPLETAMRFNGDLKWNQFLGIEDNVMTTLDKNPTGSEKVKM